jgi:YgiT-type zinc finger domain-containing protein
LNKCPLCGGPIEKGCGRFTIPYKGEIKTINRIRQYRCKPCRETFIDSEMSIKIDKEVLEMENKEL